MTKCQYQYRYQVSSSHHTKPVPTEFGEYSSNSDRNRHRKPVSKTKCQYQYQYHKWSFVSFYLFGSRWQLLVCVAAGPLTQTLSVCEDFIHVRPIRMRTGEQGVVLVINEYEIACVVPRLKHVWIYRVQTEQAIAHI
jgi:hypothetical protein